MDTQRLISLNPPNISPECIKEKVTCVRAHRERIFQVYPHYGNGKLIFHNYGHGGAGWTFLFGCVHESIRQFEGHLKNNNNLKNKPICVIGAGCYGLLTAVILARLGHNVHIIAQEIENIPSYKAAGFFFPRPRKCSTPEERAIFTTLGLESYTTYKLITENRHPFIKNGPKLLSAYYGLTIDPGFTPYIAAKLIDYPEKVTITFGTNKVHEVMKYKTIFIHSSIMMKELWRNIRELSIPVTQATINCFDDIAEEIIFNCAGLGAKKLTSDAKIIPIQGHLITLKNQLHLEDLHYMINVKVTMKNLSGMPRDELIYYAPKDEGILGITFLRGQDSLTTNQHEFERLLERCHHFFGT